jgi:hypothetical protein
MSKLARSDEPKVNQCQIKVKVQMSKTILILGFDIRLEFACLREAPPAKVLVRRAGASAKAGIWTFGFSMFYRLSKNRFISGS